MTVRQAALALTVSTATIYKLVASGSLPCIRIANSIRFDIAEFQTWVQRRQSPASPA